LILLLGKAVSVMAWLFCYEDRGIYMEKLENIVNNYYNDFQKYMPIKNMESYVLDIKPMNEMKYVMAETIKKDSIRYLFLNEGFAADLLVSKIIERWKIGILYHEFTHIADDMILERNAVPLSKKYIYRSYIEYHAEFIKTLYMLGIYPFPGNKTKISYMDKIDSQYNNVSVYDYLIKLKTGYIKDIDVNKMSDRDSFISYYDMISYYLGAASAYRLFCGYDINEIMDISEFVKKLGKSAEHLKDVLLDSITINFDEKAAIKSAELYIPLIQPFL